MSINPDQRHDLVDYSVNILVRAAVKLNDYWDVLYQGFARVKVRFDKEGIHIPYPQQEIHITEKIKRERRIRLSVNKSDRLTKPVRFDLSLATLR